MFKDFLLESKESRFYTILWYGFGILDMPSLQFIEKYRKVMIEIEVKGFIKKIVEGS